jgi:hypothetical protein
MASKKTTTKTSAPPFTQEELNTIYGVLQATWQEIGYDCLTIEGGPSTMKRAEVIEVVLDADYASRHVRTPEQKAVWDRFDKLEYAQMIKIAEGTFKSARYGL